MERCGCGAHALPVCDSLLPSLESPRSEIFQAKIVTEKHNVDECGTGHSNFSLSENHVGVWSLVY